MVYLPDHPEKFDLNWLADKLNQPEGAQPQDLLVGFDIKPIGTGQVGDSYRLTLDWKDESAQPKTLVAKCPAQDEKSRQTGAHLRNYAMEVRWYENYAQHAKIRTPFCYYTEIDDKLENFVLLMEDVAPAQQGNQLEGGSVEEVRKILAEAAHLHGFKWNDASIKNIEWLNYNKGNEGFVKTLVPSIYPEWCERYQGRIDSSILEMGKDFVARLEDYLTPRDKPVSIVHTDLRLDNILFSDSAGRAIVVDWQTVNAGTPMADVAYCIGTSFAQPQMRANNEKALVENYLKQLEPYSKGAYAFEQAWEDYRFSAFSGFLMGVIAAMLVERTERGDEMFAVMAERAGAQALHLDSLSLL